MKNIFGFVLLFISVNIYAQTDNKSPLDCRDLHEGIFTLRGYEDVVYTIVRTKDRQVESIGKTGRISQFDIKWTSDCSYLLFNHTILAGKKEPEEDMVKIDTMYNEIIGRVGDSIETSTSVKELNFEAKSKMLKLDTSTLYRNITKFEKFKDYKGEVWGSTLLSGGFSIIYRQKSSSNEDFLLGFETLISVNNRNLSQLLDHVFVKVSSNQKFTTQKCKFEGKFDDEIVVIYESTKDENADTKIIKAWRFNRKSMKIEPVDAAKVSYKMADESKSKKFKRE
jgi:hypothetical protein